MEDNETIRPRVKNNGKTINIICEICQNWLLDIKVEKIKSLLIRRFIYKGYTINLSEKDTLWKEWILYLFRWSKSKKSSFYEF